MPTELGQPVVGPARGAPAEVGSTDVTAGDVVAIDGDGLVVPADDTDETDDIGVASADGEEEDVITVYHDGIIAANVAGDVSAGEELDLSGTEGQLSGGSGGYTAWSDAGGDSPLSHGSLDDLGDNAAAVKVN